MQTTKISTPQVKSPATHSLNSCCREHAAQSNANQTIPLDEQAITSSCWRGLDQAALTKMEDDSSAVLAQAVDVNWLSFCLVLVILMQAGFACYEVRDTWRAHGKPHGVSDMSHCCVSLTVK